MFENQDDVLQKTMQKLLPERNFFRVTQEEFLKKFANKEFTFNFDKHPNFGEEPGVKIDEHGYAVSGYEIARNCNGIVTTYYVRIDDLVDKLDYVDGKVDEKKARPFISSINEFHIDYDNKTITLVDKKYKEKGIGKIKQDITMYHYTSYSQWENVIDKAFNKVWWGIKFGWSHVNYSNNVLSGSNIETNLMNGINKRLEKQGHKYRVFVNGHKKFKITIAPHDL